MSSRAFVFSVVALAAIACHRAPAAAAPAPTPSSSPTVAPRASAGTPDLDWHAALAAGKTLQLSDVSGDVQVSRADGGTVSVRAVPRGKNASKVRVVTHTEDAGIAVCVLFAEDSDADCRLGTVTHHHRESHDEDVRIDLVARLPRGVKLVAETMNGAVRAKGLESDVQAVSMNGDIELSTTGVATLKTMNGSIDASIGAAPTAALSFVTYNGAVRVRLPEKLDADVEASTMHGSITTSFPMAIETVPMGIGPKSGRARLGKGGAHIEAKTMNGDVVLRTGAS